MILYQSWLNSDLRARFFFAFSSIFFLEVEIPRMVGSDHRRIRGQLDTIQRSVVGQRLALRRRQSSCRARNILAHWGVRWRPLGHWKREQVRFHRKNRWKFTKSFTRWITQLPLERTTPKFSFALHPRICASTSAVDQSGNQCRGVREMEKNQARAIKFDYFSYRITFFRIQSGKFGDFPDPQNAQNGILNCIIWGGTKTQP